MDQRHLRAPDGHMDHGERLVERYRSVGLHLTWHPPTRSLLGTRNKPTPAEVIDLSVSGALLLAASRPRLAAGSLVHIELEGARGLVEVRHVHQALDPEQRYYGVLFMALDPTLRLRFFEQVAKQRGDMGRLEQAWRAAR